MINESKALPDFAYDDSINEDGEPYAPPGARSRPTSNGYTRLNQIAPLVELLPGFRTQRALVELRPGSHLRDLQVARAQHGVMVVDHRRIGWETRLAFESAIEVADVLIVDTLERKVDGTSRATKVHRRALKAAISSKYRLPLFVRARGGSSSYFPFDGASHGRKVVWLLPGAAYHLEELR